MSVSGIVVGVICMLVGWVIAFVWGMKYAARVLAENISLSNVYDLGFKDGATEAVARISKIIQEKGNEDEISDINS